MFTKRVDPTTNPDFNPNPNLCDVLEKTQQSDSLLSEGAATNIFATY